MVSYYGAQSRVGRSSGRGLPIFIQNPQPAPSSGAGKWSRNRPSPTAKLNEEICACESYEDVLTIFAQHQNGNRGDASGNPDVAQKLSSDTDDTSGMTFDRTNVCTSISTCARRCRDAGPDAARQCTRDERWVVLIELVGSLIRELDPRGLTMVSWGLATLKAHQPLLLRRVAWQAQQKMHLFDARSLANFVWAFATLRVRELELTVAGAKLYPTIAERAVQEMINFNPQELANVLWAFATLGSRNVPLFDAAALRLVDMLRKLNAYDLGQTVWSYASVRLRSEILLDAVAVRVKERCDVHKPINISNLCWAFAKVDYSDDDLYLCLAQIAREEVHRFNPQDLSNVLWAMATVRVHDRDLFRAISARSKRFICSRAELATQGVTTFTLTEMASILWSLAKLGEPRDEHSLLVEAASAILCGDGALQQNLHPRDISACLWALGNFGMHDLAWRGFDRLALANVNLGATSYSSLLAFAQRSHDLSKEMAVWRAMRQQVTHPLLQTAMTTAALLSCHRRRDSNAARGMLLEVLRETTDCDGPVWQALRDLAGSCEVIDSTRRQHQSAPIPQSLPRHEDMSYPELYAKELQVLAAVSAEGYNGSSAAVVRDIRRCAEERENWLKLAGGEKTAVLEKLIVARKPRLVVEVGFYVGYSSTIMGRHLRKWDGRLVSIEVDPVHAAIGQVSVLQAGLADVVDVWVGHSGDVLPRILDEFGPGSIDMAFFDQKGTRYHVDLGIMEQLELASDGCLVVADNVLKPGAPRFLWDLHHHPMWQLQIVTVREFESEEIEDWISIADYDAVATPCVVPEPPRFLEALAFETDAIRWRAMTDQLNIADWVRHVRRVRDSLGECGIEPTASVGSGDVCGLVPCKPAQARLAI
eukprot:TRINITY_DN75702_c0_g1_i1.p1 TRINITY_DN75702_c0_g1~~TRINITY_DN75702_c0_g1_i1.p1  ORF type:complete len:896 (+),score=90.77 TRINITY_DN75702_c0_g1_i1:63-2690(+)